MKNIAIVLGYGVFLESDLAYQQKYLEPVLNDILKRNPDLIITCGGCSNKNYPDLSEAQSIRDLFVKLHPELESKIITEANSLSTPENLKFTQDFITKNYPECQTVTIYSDSCRSPKVFYLSLSLFLDAKELSQRDKLIILGNMYMQSNYDFSQAVELNYQNITIVGIPLSDTMSLVSHQITSSMLEMHSFDYPDLHQQIVDSRKKKWGIK